MLTKAEQRRRRKQRQQQPLFHEKQKTSGSIQIPIWRTFAPHERYTIHEKGEQVNAAEYSNGI